MPRLHAKLILVFIYWLPIGVHAGEPACVPPMIEKKYCTTQVLLVPQEKATTVPNLSLREVEVDRFKMGYTLDFIEEKRTVTEMKLQMREVDEQVVVIENKPYTVLDSCGKPRTEYKPCQVVRTVKVKKYCAVPTSTEVIVRIPVLKPGPEVIAKKMVLDKTTLPAIEHRYKAVTSNNQIKALMPVPVVVPPCPTCKPH